MEETFGQRVRRLRLERNLSQRELGEQIGVSQFKVSNLERGRKPDHIFFQKLVDALDMDSDTPREVINEVQPNARVVHSQPSHVELDPVIVEVNKARDRTLARIERLEAEIKLTKAALHRYDAMLRAGGALPPKQSSAPKTKSPSKAPGVTDATREAIENAIATNGDLGPSPIPSVEGGFTVKQLTDAVGLSHSTVARALDVLRSEGVVRKVGEVRGSGPRAAGVFVRSDSE